MANEAPSALVLRMYSQLDGFGGARSFWRCRDGHLQLHRLVGFLPGVRFICYWLRWTASEIFKWIVAVGSRKTTTGDIRGIHGMVCWDLKSCRTPRDTLPIPDARDACITRFHAIRSHSALHLSDENSAESVMSSLYVARDIIQIYRDKDRDALRKIELVYGVRIFWGRDFEKFRIRDTPAAPRGVTRLCICGRYNNVLNAKTVLLGWIEVQGEYKEEEIRIPEYSAGNVIGRQGSRVAQMQAESKAKIDVFSRETNGCTVRVVVSGRKPARAHARKLIDNCVAHSERMQEEDRVRNHIRDVCRRIMYQESDEEEENDGALRVSARYHAVKPEFRDAGWSGVPLESAGDAQDERASSPENDQHPGPEAVIVSALANEPLVYWDAPSPESTDALVSNWVDTVPGDVNMGAQEKTVGLGGW